jgi:hypothetical protein
MDQLGGNSERNKDILNGGDTHSLDHGHIVDFQGTLSQDLENPHRPEGIDSRLYVPVTSPHTTSSG